MSPVTWLTTYSPSNHHDNHNHPPPPSFRSLSLSFDCNLRAHGWRVYSLPCGRLCRSLRNCEDGETSTNHLHRPLAFLVLMFCLSVGLPMSCAILALFYCLFTLILLYFYTIDTDAPHPNLRIRHTTLQYKKEYIVYYCLTDFPCRKNIKLLCILPGHHRSCSALIATLIKCLSC